MLSLAGHDAGKRYMVMAVLNDRVVLADGKRKTLERPKRKNPRHLALLGHCKALADKLQNQEKITDVDIKYYLKHWEE